MGRGGECGEMSETRTASRRGIGTDLSPVVSRRRLRDAPPRPKGGEMMRRRKRVGNTAAYQKISARPTTV